MPTLTISRKTDPATGQHLSEAQTARLLGYVKEKADSARQKGTNRAIIDELIILLLADAGLRPRELCNLNIADLPASHGRKTMRLRDAHGNVTRDVELSSSTAQSLRRFMRLHRKDARPSEPLLVNERGKRFGYMSLYSKVKNIGQKAKIGRLNPGMLRRAYIIRLYRRERDLRLVQIQAGHARSATTARYVHASHQRPEQNNSPLTDTVSLAVDSSDPATAHTPATKSSRPKASRLGKQDSLETPPQIDICEACYKLIRTGEGKKIDSGQILCADCLKELRKR